MPSSATQTPLMNRSMSSTSTASRGGLAGSSSEQDEPLMRSFSRQRAVRRRATPVQGRALESLGHAVEYLVDSRLFLSGIVQHDEQEAQQILMQLSRSVFSECAEVVPLGRRLSQWMSERLERAR